MIEIKIGRAVSGSSVINVPETFKKVSRKHATLIWDDGQLTLIDDESTCGTYVNGKRIAKTKLKPGDVVTLGGIGSDGFTLDLQKVYDECGKAEMKNKTDYSEELESLKKAYTDYQSELAELKKNAAMKSQLPMRLASFIPMLIGIIAAACIDGIAVRIIAGIAGVALSVLINIFLIGKNSGNDMSEKIVDLQLKYQPRYRCPKCGKDYSLSAPAHHWKMLQSNGECPYKCGAKF